MKNAAVAVLKKELARFFGDKRLVFTSIILPGLLIFVMYSLMGTAMDSFVSVDDTYVYSVEAVNIPQSISKLFSAEEFKITEIEADGVEKSKNRLAEEEIDLCVVFPDNFEEAIANFSPYGNPDDVPNVEVYYNSTKISSGTAYDIFAGKLDALETSISNVFNINSITDEADVNKYDVATDEDTMGMMLASILPMLLIILLYSSCVALAPESIAGEKERGTIATMLVTPAPRNQIVFGKISALAIIALLGGLSSFLGTFLSMPMMMSGIAASDLGVSTQFYVFTDYLWLILLILSTVLLFITVISIISATAKTVKEAGTMVTPLMIVVMLVAFSSVFSTAAKEDFIWYFIPVYNSLQSMIGIFSFTASTVNIALTVVSNVVYSLIGIMILAKMFSSEKIIYSK